MSGFVFEVPQAIEWMPKDLWMKQNLLVVLYKLDLNDEDPIGIRIGNGVGFISTEGAWSFGPTV